MRLSFRFPNCKEFAEAFQANIVEKLKGWVPKSAKPDYALTIHNLGDGTNLSEEVINAMNNVYDSL